MDCTKCKSKGCRVSAPCQDNSDQYIDDYFSDEVREYTSSASKLIDNGRAGTLSRLQEIIEFIKLRGYSKVGCAYCYGMEKDAGRLREIMSAEGFNMHMVSCTVDQVREKVLDTSKTKDTVSCNPLGQAHQLNRQGVEFTILMGLCLGHDILLQKNLEMDFTTFIVKDRVHQHNPRLALYADE